MAVKFKFNALHSLISKSRPSDQQLDPAIGFDYGQLGTLSLQSYILT